MATRMNLENHSRGKTSVTRGQAGDDSPSGKCLDGSRPVRRGRAEWGLPGAGWGLPGGLPGAEGVGRSCSGGTEFQAGVMDRSVGGWVLARTDEEN